MISGGKWTFSIINMAKMKRVKTWKEWRSVARTMNNTTFRSVVGNGGGALAWRVEGNFLPRFGFLLRKARKCSTQLMDARWRLKYGYLRSSFSKILVDWNHIISRKKNYSHQYYRYLNHLYHSFFCTSQTNINLCLNGSLHILYSSFGS